MKDFTLKDLKQGMVLHTRDNQKYTMINDKEFYVEDISNLGSTYAYNKDLTSEENNLEDILKITFGNEIIYERPKEVEKTPIDWKPEINEKYYLVDREGDVGRTQYNNDDYDKPVLRIGRVFKTRKEAEQHRDWLKAKRTLEIEIARLNGGWTPDWSNKDESKYYVMFDYGRDNFQINTNATFKERPNSMYLRDSERAKDLIKSHEKELKIYYEVEE